MTPMGNVGWQKTKGIVVHRCALAAAGKPLSLWLAERPEDDGAGGSGPNFVVQAQWLAQQLGAALADEDDEVVWSLFDAGGPAWIGEYNVFRRLRRRDKERVVEDLGEIVVEAATAILAMARKEQWESMLSEVLDPFEFLEPPKNGKLHRMDLLVRRESRVPLVVDLKTGASAPSPAHLVTLTDSLVNDYGQRLAKEWASPIGCQILYVSFGGGHRWGEERLVEPAKRKR